MIGQKIVIKRLGRVLIVGSLLTLALVLGSEKGSATQPFFQTGGTGEIYTQQCSPCHGAEGEGSAFGPALIGGTSSVDDRIDVISSGSGAMPAFGPTLTQDQIAQLVALIDSLSGAPDSPVQLGARVYADNCASCHGVDAGGGIGPSLKTTTDSHDSLIASVSQGTGSMPGFADQLAAAEIEAVIAFLEDLSGAGVEPPAGDAEGLFADYCSRCHGPDASGGVGPALKTSRLTPAEMVPVIGNGRGAMPAFSAILTSAEVDALVVFLQENRTVGGDGSAVLDATAGRDIYVAACSTCHGLNAGGGVGPRLTNTRLTINEIISQVFGAHSAGMPTFEGVLDAVQVQDVARYVLKLEGDSGSQTGWLVLVVVAILAVAGAIGLWYSGLFDQLLRRFRGGSRRGSRSPGEE
ncbi:MAG: c-type cytochrome [Acidimicrobiia bacterium]|nr:c-type cytochrome [Acidimicrobiia bacterium]